MQSDRPEQSRGAVLSEVIIITIIVAVLAAILFPICAGARSDTNIAYCLRNLRKMGVALQAYQNDYNGCVPPVRNVWWSTSFGGKHLFQYLLPYTHTADVFRCKSKLTRTIAASMQGIWTTDGGIYRGACYTTSAYAFKKTASTWAQVPFANGNQGIQFASYNFQTNLACAGPSEAVALTCMAGDWVAFPNSSGGVSGGGHGGRALVLFADWHASTVAGNSVGKF